MFQKSEEEWAWCSQFQIDSSPVMASYVSLTPTDAPISSYV